MYNNSYDDNTPILSYAKMGNINLMWPCRAYTITLPVFRDSRLSIFEETYLKLSNLKYSRLESISYAMSLDVDTAKAIQKKLIDCGYIDFEGNISDSGKKYIEDRLNPSEIVGANIIVEMVSGELLSAVIPRGLKKYYVRKSDNGKGLFFEKPKNKENIKVLNLCFIKPVLNDAIPIPTKKSIYYAAKTFLKRKNLSIAREIEILDFTGDLNSIGIDKIPAPCYLHVPIAIYNAEFYAKDPFGFGTSKFFYDKVVELLQTNETLKAKIHKAMEREGSSSRQKSSSPFTEYRNPIDEKYASICGNYKKYIDAIENHKDPWEVKNLVNNIIKDIYSALEWTMREIYDRNKPDESAIIALAGGTELNKRILCECAESLGIAVGNHDSLLAVDGGKIKAVVFDSTKAEMLPLLSLLIYSAKINTKHPFRNMPDNLSDNLLGDIRGLKNLRDPIQHGGKADTDKNMREKIEKYKEFLEQFISATLPDIKFNNSAGEVDSNTKINVRNSLNKKLDLALQYRISRISKKLWDELLQLESLSLNEDKKLYSSLIDQIYTVSQILIDETVNNMPRREIDADGLKNISSDRAKAYFNMEELPSEISTTKRLGEKLERGSSTLGAAIICLLALLNENDLDVLSKEYPNFIEDMARIIFLRGHGNKPSYMVIKELSCSEEIFKLKDKIYNLIKILVRE